MIYALVDPRCGRPRYVGRARDVHARYRAHLRESGSSPKCRWVNDLRIMDLEPRLLVLDDDDSLERRWIRRLRRRFPLTNVQWARRARQPAAPARPVSVPTVGEIVELARARLGCG